MSLIVKTVGSASRDYSTMAGWMASLPANLVTDGNSYEADCYNDSDSFTVHWTLTGHTTDSSHTITITCGAGQSFRDNANVQTHALVSSQANGVYHHESANYNAIANIVDANVTLSGLQFRNTGNGRCLDVAAVGAFTAQYCIFESTRITTQGTVASGAGGQAYVISNSLIVQRHASGYGISQNTSTSHFNCYNVTFVVPSGVTNTGYAYKQNYGTITLENCAAFGFGNLTGGTSTFSITTCMTDIVSPPSGWTGSLTYANQFQNTASDWRAKAGADLLDAGTTDTTHSSFDIAGTSRPQGSAYDIGCWELVVSAAASQPLAEDEQRALPPRRPFHRLADVDQGGWPFTAVATVGQLVTEEPGRLPPRRPWHGSPQQTEVGVPVAAAVTFKPLAQEEQRLPPRRPFHRLPDADQGGWPFTVVATVGRLIIDEPPRLPPRRPWHRLPDVDQGSWPFNVSPLNTAAYLAEDAQHLPSRRPWHSIQSEHADLQVPPPSPTSLFFAYGQAGARSVGG